MANVTVTKKSDASGCPIFSTGAPGIPVTILEPSGGRTIVCWLRPASSLFAAVDAGGPVLFDESELPARRAADEFAGGHVRNTAEQSADVAAVAAGTAEDAKIANARTILQTYLDNVRVISPGSRTPEQRAIYALSKLVANRE
jgi:hypothetical protein